VWGRRSHAYFLTSKTQRRDWCSAADFTFGLELRMLRAISPSRDGKLARRNLVNVYEPGSATGGGGASLLELQRVASTNS
jgi:hypothetical protein